jgi:hypothetical protein
MPDDTELNCEQCGYAFDDLMAGTGGTPLHRRVLDQLETVAKCERCFATYKRTAELCRAQLVKDVPAQVGEKLLAFLRRQAEKG